MTKQEQKEYEKQERNTFLYGFTIGMLIMSQIAGILCSASYDHEIPKRWAIAKIWSK